MSNLKQYKCPSCGGQINYDIASGQLKCPYCGSKFEIDTLQGYDEDLKNTVEEELNWMDKPEQFFTETEESQLRHYVCDSCGGEIIADVNTGATSCPYCGNPVIVPQKFSGILKPDLVVPFKIDEKQAKEAYKKHLKGKPLLPKFFKDENRINELKGIYVPFWLYDAEVDMAARYRTTRSRTWSDSDYNYTETSYYSVYREGEIGFDNVPVDGSTNIDDVLMESIEPFDIDEAVDFKTAYLAGYLADKYDISAEESKEQANQRMRTSAEMALASTIRGYDSIALESMNMGLNNHTIKYCLLPVYILNTTYKGQKYTFAMNGQTGKLVGDLPVDKGAYAMYFSIIFVIVAVIAYVIQMFIIGG